MTRLAATVGAAAAAEVYRALLAHTLEIATRSGVDVLVSIAETADRRWAGGIGAPVELQGAGDLGQRMGECFRRRFERGRDRVLVIGSDNPSLRVDHVDAALRALDAAPVVLGPAADGGYWLVGQRAPGVDLFSGVPWTSPDTMAATRARLGVLGVDWCELENLNDIDTADDLWRAIDDPEIDRRLHSSLVRALRTGGAHLQERLKDD